MKNIIRIASLFAVAFGFNHKSTAEEYIRLSTNLGGSKYIVLDRKSSSFSETPNTYEYGQEINTYAKSEIENVEKIKVDSYKLSDGEAIELSKPMFTVYSGPPMVPEEFPNESGGDNWSWDTADFGGSTSTLTSGNSGKLFVKFPESEKWHEIYYQEGSWRGIGTGNPIIVGPCEIKLESKANIRLFHYKPNSGRHDPNIRFAAVYESYVSWVFMKKIAVGSSSGVTKTAQSIVLPEGSGDLNIIMEGSNDLINWTREDLGKKPEANRKTFYRIRAVKE